MDCIFHAHDTRATPKDVSSLLALLLSKEVKINSVGRFTVVFNSQSTIRDFCSEWRLTSEHEELLCYAAHKHVGADQSAISWKAWRCLNAPKDAPTETTRFAAGVLPVLVNNVRVYT